jgi:hypothetical protein
MVFGNSRESTSYPPFPGGRSVVLETSAIEIFSSGLKTDFFSNEYPKPFRAKVLGKPWIFM